jgi:hypothetical protein
MKSALQALVPVKLAFFRAGVPLPVGLHPQTGGGDVGDLEVDGFAGPQPEPADREGVREQRRGDVRVYAPVQTR